MGDVFSLGMYLVKENLHSTAIRMKFDLYSFNKFSLRVVASVFSPYFPPTGFVNYSTYELFE